MTRSASTFPHYGSVSHGTLRLEDLIPAFVDALSDVLEWDSLNPNPRLSVAEHEACQDELGLIERWIAEEDYFESDGAIDALEWLQDTLQDLAPEGYRFGAHEGDGSDYGFWPEPQEYVSMTITPRIYVTSLADYNAGRLHGVWIDANQDAESILEEVNAMLAESEEPAAEEWAIHDHEGFGGVPIDEHEDFETVSRLAALLEEHGEPFAVWYQEMYSGGLEPEEWEEAFAEGFEGEYESPEDWAAEYISDAYGSRIPQAISSYIDYTSYARDAEYEGLYFAEVSYRKYYVFRNY